MTAALGSIEKANGEVASSSRRLADLVFKVREFGIIAVLAIFVIATASIQPRFVDSENIEFIFTNATIYALLALGETTVVVARNIDLSVGSVLGLSAYLSADMFAPPMGSPSWSCSRWVWP